MRDMDFISPSAMMSLFSDVPLKPKAERGFEQDRRFSARLLHDLSSHPPPHTDSTLSSCQGKARRWVKLATVSHAHRPCTVWAASRPAASLEGRDKKFVSSST
jgi:hypothetical protein